MVRPYDSVGRYGGEEFLIVAPGCGIAETWELAERVRVHVAGCNIITGGSNVQVSLSLGIATGDERRISKNSAGRRFRALSGKELGTQPRRTEHRPGRHGRTSRSWQYSTATSGSRFFIADIARAGAPALLCFQSSRVIFRI